MKSKLIYIFSVTCLAFAISASARTPKGPKQFTSAAPTKTVKAAIVEDMTKAGYAVASDNDFAITLSRSAPDAFLAQVLLTPSGCQSITPRKIWTFTITESNGITTVTPSGELEHAGPLCQPERMSIPMGKKWEKDFDALLSGLK